MKFDIDAMKDKLFKKRSTKSEEQTKPVMQAKPAKQKTSESKHGSKKSSGSGNIPEQIKKTVFSYFSKDKKAKRVMKQSERGIIMIIGSIIIGYGAYALLYQPSVEKRDSVMKSYAKTETRRQDILTHLNNQATLLKNIDKYNAELNTYKAMYPNYRTQNEILKVVSDLLAKENASPATFVKGPTKMAQKSVMLNFINNKQLQSKVKSYQYFGGTTTTDKKDGSNADGTTSQPSSDQSTSQDPNAAVPEADKTNFQYTEVTFSVVDLSKQRALDIMDTFSKSKRIIIPESWNMSGGEDGKYRLEGTVLFFAYRDKDSPEPLF